METLLNAIHSVIESLKNRVDSIYKSVKSLNEDVSTKMDKKNPTGTGAFSMNRKEGTDIGLYSHAEGFDTTASQNFSHAEGYNTTASNYGSHAEGDGTTASGYGSHAEGYATTSASSNQHVQGKYNIVDSSSTYSDIVGNGTYSKRSNASTLDWKGNAWFAGDVYVGSTSGTNKDSGSVKLAKSTDLDAKQDTLTDSDKQAIADLHTDKVTSINGETGAVELTIPTVPDTLPNPYKLTLTGAVEATYDGSETVEVTIPEGGGSSAEWVRVLSTTTTFTEDTSVSSFQYTCSTDLTDASGNPTYKEIILTWRLPKASSAVQCDVYIGRQKCRGWFGQVTNTSNAPRFFYDYTPMPLSGNLGGKFVMLNHATMDFIYHPGINPSSNYTGNFTTAIASVSADTAKTVTDIIIKLASSVTFYADSTAYFDVYALM